MSATGSTHTHSCSPSRGSTSGERTTLTLPPSVTDAQEWSSVVLDYSLRFEHVALNITSNRILYHLKLALQEPIPPAYLEFSSYLCLGWPLGGIWKITKRDEGNRRITCVAWKETELSTNEITELAKEYVPVPAARPAAASFAETLIGAFTLHPTDASTPPATNNATNGKPEPEYAIHPPPKTLFDWKMQLGTWKHVNHWFVREVGLPPAYASRFEVPVDTQLSVKLFAGLTPVKVSMVVNSIQALDTVAQRFTADVTWELTLPGITTIREDSVLRELLDLLEFNEDALEFSNITDVHSEKSLVTTLSQESERIQYFDPFVPKETVTQRLHHLTYSRRLVAEFNEEMTLQTFPFDQQKLTFSFNMSKCIAPFIPIAPVSGDPGRFTLENFKLGNVWKVVCGDKLFVGNIVDHNATKLIRFEMMLERRSMYYLTNVAIPAAIITYLCFTSYAPLKAQDTDDASATGDEKGRQLMDTGARLQIVLTLLLTAVTFKSQVASLIPQVSYFTTLDKYVFVCFIIACVVATENALFPLVANLFGPHSGSWSEYSLLWFSIWSFTLINVVWGVYLYHWTRERNQRIKALMVVTEYVRVIAHAIPNHHKEQVLRGFLEGHKYKSEMLPAFFTTKRGDLFVKLPSDSPTEEHHKAKHESGIIRKQALRDLPAIQKYFHELDPYCTSPVPSPVSSSPAGSPKVAAEGVAAVVAKEYSDASVVVNIQEGRRSKRGSRSASSSRFFAHGG